MKNIFNFFLLALGLLTSLFVTSCQTDDAVLYEGEAKVHFINESGEVFVVTGTGHTDYLIDFGSLNVVSGNKQVKLVTDVAKSTAIEGVDFQILNNGLAEIAGGNSRGQFIVRVFETNMTQTPMKAVFKLQSSDIANAVFKQEFVLDMSLTCPINTFVGDFELTNSFFWDAGDVFQVIEDPTTPNQLRIVGFMDDGSDFVVKYNPDTYVVTFDTQSTGYIHPTYNAAILIRPATNTSLISSFNPCTRKLTIYMDYWMNGVGGWTNQNEAFSGI